MITEGTIDVSSSTAIRRGQWPMTAVAPFLPGAKDTSAAKPSAVRALLPNLHGHEDASQAPRNSVRRPFTGNLPFNFRVTRDPAGGSLYVPRTPFPST